MPPLDHLVSLLLTHHVSDARHQGRDILSPASVTGCGWPPTASSCSLSRSPAHGARGGQVMRVFTGNGGVPLFAVDLGSARVNWIPVAVVVNAEGLAVGLSAWSRSGPPAEEVSVSASALREPCR